jgi:hypothetical protein
MKTIKCDVRAYSYLIIILLVHTALVIRDYLIQ